MSFFSKVTFTVKAVVMPGETIMVSGDAEALGRFNQERAIRLYTTPETYPVWRTLEPVTIPRDVALTYR